MIDRTFVPIVGNGGVTATRSEEIVAKCAMTGETCEPTIGRIGLDHPIQESAIAHHDT
jgi:hypothetical protein